MNDESKVRKPTNQARALGHLQNFNYRTTRPKFSQCGLLPNQIKSRWVVPHVFTVYASFVWVMFGRLYTGAFLGNVENAKSKSIINLCHEKWYLKVLKNHMLCGNFLFLGVEMVLFMFGATTDSYVKTNAFRLAQQLSMILKKRKA